MSLKKLLAGYYKEWKEEVFHEDGSSHFEARREWIPQQEVDMHPLEEAEVRAHWAIGDSMAKMPRAPSKEEEHDWLIEHGSEYVKQKRAEWKSAHAEWLKSHEPLVAEHRRHADAYEAHFKSLDKSEK